MSKTYKIPVILAFYNDGDLKIKINDMDIYISLKEFYASGSNGIDISRHKEFLTHVKDVIDFRKNEFYKERLGNDL